MAAKPWFSGVVREVLGGDVVVISSAGRLPNGETPTQRLNLAYLSALRLERVGSVLLGCRSAVGSRLKRVVF